MTTELLLGIDIGTSSTKGVLVTPDGEIVAIHSVAHQTSNPRPGWYEHDAESVWWADFLAVARALLRDETRKPIAVGVSGIGPCFLPLGQADAPLRPAILYGVDTRAVQEINELEQRYGRDNILRRCGTTLNSQAVGPKMLWVRRNEPEVWAETRRWMMASSYLTHQLTGAYVLDHNSASMVAPLYDLTERKWISEWCDDVAPGLAWPDLTWPGDVVGRVNAEAAAQTGIETGTPVVAGTVDALSEACSIGARMAGDVMVMYGTTLLLFEVRGDRPPPPEHLTGAIGVYPGISPDSYNLTANLTTSGALLDWVAKLTGVSHEDLTAQANGIAPGANGLVMLPYFAGMRAPVFDPRIRGVCSGLTLAHGPADLYRAALESIGFATRFILDAMIESGAKPERLIAVGGGTASSLWPRVVSDILGKSQQIPKYTVGAAYGDALLAGYGVDVVSQVAEWNPVVDEVHPREENVAVYNSLYEAFKELLRAVPRPGRV